MKVAIVGSRNYTPMRNVKFFVDNLPDGTIVVSGGARGVDKAAVTYAKSRGLKTKVFYAEWGKFGKRAGFLRNALIVDYCDELMAFWDGESKGTQHSINLAKAAGKPVAIAKGTARTLPKRIRNRKSVKNV